MYYEIPLKEETDAEKIFSKEKIYEFLDIKSNSLLIFSRRNKLYLNGQKCLFLFYRNLVVLRYQISGFS